MNVFQFLNYIHYSRECPDHINKARWNGMLKWYDTRVKLGEDIP